MAYLFVYFTMNDTGDEETVWYSLSEDGLHWKDLGNGPVLRSHVGTKGIRDPFLVYDENQKKYFMIATDLNTADGHSWYDAAHRGSRCLLTWESEDLIHWSDARLIEVGVEGAGCVWAPEAVYSTGDNAWFVFWASMVREPGDPEPKQRIYGAFTKDFLHFSPAFKYIEAESHIIDTDIVYDGGWYYRFSKDETGKSILLERCRRLIPQPGQRYRRIPCPLLDGWEGLEGPTAYYLEKERKWCLLVDQYRIRGGYLPLLTGDLSSGIFERLPESAFDLGRRPKRHGGVLPIPEALAARLTAHYGIAECFTGTHH